MERENNDDVNEYGNGQSRQPTTTSTTFVCFNQNSQNQNITVHQQLTHEKKNVQIHRIHARQTAQTLSRIEILHEKHTKKKNNNKKIRTNQYAIIVNVNELSDVEFVCVSAIEKE